MFQACGVESQDFFLHFSSSAKVLRITCPFKISKLCTQYFVGGFVAVYIGLEYSAGVCFSMFIDGCVLFVQDGKP